MSLPAVIAGQRHFLVDVWVIIVSEYYHADCSGLI